MRCLVLILVLQETRTTELENVLKEFKDEQANLLKIVSNLKAQLASTTQVQYVEVPVPYEVPVVIQIAATTSTSGNENPSIILTSDNKCRTFSGRRRVKKAAQVKDRNMMKLSEFFQILKWLM